ARGAVDRFHRLRSVSRKCGLGWSAVVLEQAVILEGNAPDAAKDGTLHEMIGIGTESVNDIMVVPDVDLGYLRVCTGKRLRPVPLYIVIEIIIIASCSHLVWERMYSSLMRVGNFGPGFQWTIHPYSIIVDLVATANHDMKRPFLMNPKHIVPQKGSFPVVEVRAD